VNKLDQTRKAYVMVAISFIAVLSVIMLFPRFWNGKSGDQSSITKPTDLEQNVAVAGMIKMLTPSPQKL